MYRVFRHVSPSVRQEAFDRFAAAWEVESARIQQATGSPPGLRFPPLQLQPGVRVTCCPIGVVIVVQEERMGREAMWGMVGSSIVPEFIPGTTHAEAHEFMRDWDGSVIASLEELAAAMGAEHREGGAR